MIAREIDSFTPIAEIYNQKEGIFEKAKSVQNFEELKNEIINLKDDYIVITMGAGNIDDLYKILNLKK
jgi:exopolysaccharide biosynthesis predicted pyruvyltransferase EpsI